MEKFIKIKEELESLKDKGISLLDMMVYDEITCQLEEEINEVQFEMLFSKVSDAYLKTDDCSLYGIVKFCVNNLDKIDDMSIWEILENSYVVF